MEPGQETVLPLPAVHLSSKFRLADLQVALDGAFLCLASWQLCWCLVLLDEVVLTQLKATSHFSEVSQASPQSTSSSCRSTWAAMQRSAAPSRRPGLLATFTR